jgi:hypothetical protein
MQNIFLEISGYGEVNRIYRTMFLTPLQAYDLWGDKLHPKMLEKLDEEKTIMKFVEACVPAAVDLGIPFFNSCIVDVQNTCSERLQDMESQQKNQEAYNKEVADVLDRNWGAAYKEKLADVDSFLTKIAPKLLNKSVDESWAAKGGALGDPLALMMMAGIGAAVRREPAERGTSNIAPMDAKTRLNLIETDPEMSAAYFNDSHPKHKEAVRQKEEQNNRR